MSSSSSQILLFFRLKSSFDFHFFPIPISFVVIVFPIPYIRLPSGCFNYSVRFPPSHISITECDVHFWKTSSTSWRILAHTHNSIPYRVLFPYLFFSTPPLPHSIHVIPSVSAPHFSYQISPLPVFPRSATTLRLKNRLPFFTR